jgi:hypothetical protein
MFAAVILSASFYSDRLHRPRRRECRRALRSRVISRTSRISCATSRYSSQSLVRGSSHHPCRVEQEQRRGSIPELLRSECLPASSGFRSPQFVAGKCVLCERRLIGEVRRALGREHTGSGAASYSFGSNESGNLGIVIVARHDLSLLASRGVTPNTTLFCVAGSYSAGFGTAASSYELFYIDIK